MNCKHCDKVIYERVTKIKRKVLREWFHFATNVDSCLIIARTKRRFMRRDVTKITLCMNCSHELAVAEDMGFGDMHRYWAHVNTGHLRDQKCPYVATPKAGVGSLGEDYV